MKTKVQIVDAIPDGASSVRGQYEGFWKDLKKTPVGKFLEVTVPRRGQKLIANYIYYKARKTHKKVSIAYKPRACYIYWR